ncbi:hypothetical protein WJX81_003297 [Elliptochloris bilobata]|uniref:Uncharacterized protein n=1 Tax=Elliptochloris bilobata TaxID=381761 RepID=A0AAW1RSJ6_9CHLO
MAQGGAYFIGKNELLGWINTTLALNLSKIEQTATGAVACQLLDTLHPGIMNISKVDFNAKNEYDFINNYKVLQAAFLKLNVDKPVPVNSLIKARPLDNMEFMQWFKAYADARGGCQPGYNAPERRLHAKTGDMRGAAGAARHTISGGVPATSAPRRGGAAGAPPPRDTSARAPPAKENIHPGTAAGEPGGKPVLGTRSNVSDAGSLITAQRQELQEQVMELKLKVDGAERERDFYFDKLRDIEILCQTPGLADIPVVKTIERILYANDEAEAKQAMAEAQAQYAG